MAAYDLGHAPSEVTNLRVPCRELVAEVSEITGKWGVKSQFPNKWDKKKRKHFDGLCEDQTD